MRSREAFSGVLWRRAQSLLSTGDKYRQVFLFLLTKIPFLLRGRCFLLMLVVATNCVMALQNKPPACLMSRFMTKWTIELIICPLASIVPFPLMATILRCFLFHRAVIFNHIFFQAAFYHFPAFFFFSSKRDRRKALLILTRDIISKLLNKWNSFLFVGLCILVIAFLGVS